MTHAIRFLKYWVPTLGWMGVIFYGSSDQESAQHASRFLGPFLHWLFPGLSGAGYDAVMLGVRKLAHVTEYAILAALAWWSLGAVLRRHGGSWPRAGLALLVVVLYAATDEFHQSFVPTRQGTPTDVLIDSVGGTLGLILVWGILRLASRFRRSRGSRTAAVPAVKAGGRSSKISA